MLSQEESQKGIQSLNFATFLRKFEQRATGIMWLLGAGASRACNIKTAGDMIWDFKARLYRSAQGVPASAVADLGDQRVRAILQRFFDTQQGFPTLGREDEYSCFFERTYPESQDRRTYLAQLMKGAKPSFGHKALAHLMKRDLCRIVWTTNFDRVFEDAVTDIFETQSIMVVADLGEPTKAGRGYAEGQWPIYAKLHGDFHSDSLKNTSDEIAEQDAGMRQVFLDTCRNHGLIVSGYSGRDTSVLKVLNEAIHEGAGFPNGLFWFLREQDTPYDSVVHLINTAKAQGVDADFVKVGSFDELLSEIVRYLPQTEGLAIKLGDQKKLSPRKIDLNDRKATVPFVRTNALPIVEYPNTCRLIECEIGGAKEIEEVLASAKSDLIASRINKGVLCFGDDGEIKRVFGSRDITRMDTHGIISERLNFESGERSLLRAALFRALESHCGLKIENRRHRHIIRADKATDEAKFGFGKLAIAASEFCGVVQGTDIAWTEACDLRLDHRLENLWLLINPFVHIDAPEDVEDEPLTKARDFVRERRAQRYNRQSNNILDGWAFALFGDANSVVDIGVDGGTGNYARKLVTVISGGVFDLLDPVLERHSFDDVGEMA